MLVDEKQRPVGIVAEYLDGGDLETLIHGNENEQPAVIPLPKKISYAIDICKGMSWLMGKDVCVSTLSSFFFFFHLFFFLKISFP